MPFRLDTLRSACLIAVATTILLLPAITAGRPFIYWDTPTFYSWGHDILAAIRHPWPPLSAFPDQFPAHRGLWAADNMHGAWDRITPGQFQLVLTSIGARSKFYAVPLYLLGSTFTLWAMAGIQAWIMAWLLWVTCAAVLSGPRIAAYLILVTALTVTTTAGFYAAFLMPDVFGGFGLLALTLLLCFHHCLARPCRIALAVLLTAAVLVHLANGAVLVATLAAAAIGMRLLLPRAPMLRGTGVVAIALVCAAGLALLSDSGMRRIFGEPVRPPPFAEARVIADGPGERFLRKTCPRRSFAACRYKDLEVEQTDDVLWPDLSWHGLPIITDPAERRRFLDEQPAVVLGTLTHYPLQQLRASLRDAYLQIQHFSVAGDIPTALIGLVNAGTDRTMRIMQIVPDIQPCFANRGRACDDQPLMRVFDRVQYAVVVLSLAVLALRTVQWLRPGTVAEKRRLAVFALVVLGGVVVNAAVCGALSAPWERYQARVIWLLPTAAVLLTDQGPFRLERLERRRAG